ncbi:hypothetical protein [Clostridium subterminale]
MDVTALYSNFEEDWSIRADNHRINSFDFKSKPLKSCNSMHQNCI